MKPLQRVFQWLCVFTLMWPVFAGAHSASTAYLRIDPQPDGTVALQWRIALRDIDALLDLDKNADGQLQWHEVSDRSAEIAAMTRSALLWSIDGTQCPLTEPRQQFLRLDDAGFLQVDTAAQCPAKGSALLHYAWFEHIDPSHRVLATIAGEAAPQLLAPGETLSVSPSGTPPQERPSDFSHFAVTGIGHILSGIDHVLFLVGLMLPAVMRRERVGNQMRWVARHDLPAALFAVIGIATAFTIAHSLTLGAATFGWVRVPARVIEPLIAATVLATALNNLWPVVTRRLWLVAFAFGLIHGFGFAEVLAPLQLPKRELALALLGFNGGVEIGQLMIIGTTFALLALARNWSGYVRYVLHAGSAVLATVAAVWIVERLGFVNLTLIS